MGGIWVGGDYIKNNRYVSTFFVSSIKQSSYYNMSPFDLYSIEDPHLGPMETVAPELLAFWSEEE